MNKETTVEDPNRGPMRLFMACMFCLLIAIVVLIVLIVRVA